VMSEEKECHVTHLGHYFNPTPLFQSKGYYSFSYSHVSHKVSKVLKKGISLITCTKATIRAGQNSHKCEISLKIKGFGF
jgi:hypothetical protein